MAYTPAELLLGKKLRKYGIVNPLYTIRAAKSASISVPLACAFLEQESGGGRNAWGHDPTIFVGGYDALHKRSYGPLVTRDGYLAYKAERGPTGRGGMQGVGPMQLTYYSYQDEADKLGGCWHPLHNMTVGFKLAASLIRRNGLQLGIKTYNGSGAAADAYAANVLRLQSKWQARL